MCLIRKRSREKRDHFEDQIIHLKECQNIYYSLHFHSLLNITSRFKLAGVLDRVAQVTACNKLPEVRCITNTRR